MKPNIMALHTISISAQTVSIGISLGSMHHVVESLGITSLDAICPSTCHMRTGIRPAWLQSAAACLEYALSTNSGYQLRVFDEI